jgi:hypothetical protein
MAGAGAVLISRSVATLGSPRESLTPRLKPDR